MSVVFVGAVITVLWTKIDPHLPKGILLGLFAGGMTSTPALALSQELLGNSPVIGYGIAYFFGLFSVVLFVQILSKKEESKEAIIHLTKRSSVKEPLLWISLTVLLGQMLGLVLPFGNTGCVLLSGLFVGVLWGRKKDMATLNTYRTLGLILFLIGAGVPAGMQLLEQWIWRYAMYGAVISCGGVIFGYMILRVVFRFQKVDALCVLCGGMTSTPAIGALQRQLITVDLPLYTISYTGALTAILVIVRLLDFMI